MTVYPHNPQPEGDPKRPRRQGLRAIHAKYEGQCPNCEEPIQEGEIIVFDPTWEAWVHGECTDLSWEDPD